MKPIRYKGEQFFADVVRDKEAKRHYANVEHHGKVVARTKNCMTKGGALLEARKEVERLVNGDG